MFSFITSYTLQETLEYLYSQVTFPTKVANQWQCRAHNNLFIVLLCTKEHVLFVCDQACEQLTKEWIENSKRIIEGGELYIFITKCWTVLCFNGYQKVTHVITDHTCCTVIWTFYWGQCYISGLGINSNNGASLKKV